MAAPASKTIEDLNGKWVLVSIAPNSVSFKIWTLLTLFPPILQNKSLSDSTDAVLALQGIGYLTRSAIGLASITNHLNQYTGSSEVPDLSGTEFTYLENVQTASGLKGFEDTHCLDNQPREATNWLFGTVTNHVRWATPEDISDEFLIKGWLDEVEGKTLILTVSENKNKGWTLTKATGFQIINGERHYCERGVVEKGSKRAEVLLVFDYVS
ncbi:hypothetical protein FALBO_13099 [Fusarium albosuccineum]|uniref:Lipocalin-like domain-containing protein n=1 Tax=Fusarium albosuccineum TaxID=1237068 RepID=A0A8H4P7E2_9HYPO|nr:hypothetical protein FALBO_13099 [Fusarium albosuccineum]